MLFFPSRRQRGGRTLWHSPGQAPQDGHVPREGVQGDQDQRGAVTTAPKTGFPLVVTTLETGFLKR